MNRAVFLDRDNTLIINDGDLAEPERVRLMQGAASAVASLRGLGYKIVVVSNQGGVARGKFTEAQVEATNQRIADMVRQASGAKIDRFYFCPYHPEGTVGPYAREHPWRKPSPGMLLQAATDLELDLAQSWMVGDQLRDVQAGLAAGVRTVLLRDDAEELAPLRTDQADAARLTAGAGAGPKPHFTAKTLIEAVRVIAQARKPETVPEAVETDGRNRRPAVTFTGVPGRTWSLPAPPSLAEPAGSAPLPAVSVPVAPAAQRASAPAVPEAQRGEVTAEDVEISPPAPPRDPSVETTLRQILQELRNQRGMHSDFSFVRVIAIVLQVVAGFCVLAALLMNGSEHDPFFKLIAVGVVLELATIAMLLFGR